MTLEGEAGEGDSCLLREGYQPGRGGTVVWQGTDSCILREGWCLVREGRECGSGGMVEWWGRNDCLVS
jgi:hypothetical protein